MDVPNSQIDVRRFSMLSAAVMIGVVALASPSAALSPTDLSIQQAAVARANVGEVVSFKLSVVNSGPGTLPLDSGASVTGELPPNFELVFLFDGSPWGCRVEGRKFGCTYVGVKITPGQSFPAIVVQARAIAAGAFALCGHIRIQSTSANAGHIDQGLSNNDVCINGTVIQGALTPRIEEAPKPNRAPTRN